MNSRTVAAVCLIALLLLHLTGGGLAVSPVPGQGFHLLIREDRSKRAELPAGQFDAMFSGEVAELITKAGGRRYLFDRNQDVSATKDEWLIKAMAIPVKTLPDVVIDKDGRGETGPLKATAAEHKAFVEGYLK